MTLSPVARMGDEHENPDPPTVASQSMLRRLGGVAPPGACRKQTASPEPDSAAPTDSNDLFRRVCNCDLRAYTQRTGRGYSQGFVLVRDCAPPSPVRHIETLSPSVFALLQRILLPVFWHCDLPFQLVFDALA